MSVFDQEREYDRRFPDLIGNYVRIMRAEEELADKGKLVFETSAPFSSEHGKQWIKLYEKAVIGRNDYDDENKCEFKSGLTMIRDAWFDKDMFIIVGYTGSETVFFGLRNPYRLEYLINKYRGIQEKVAQTWKESEFGNADGAEM